MSCIRLTLTLLMSACSITGLACRPSGTGGGQTVRLRPNDPSLTEVAFLTGAWTTAQPSADRVEEHWTAPSAGSMLGISRTIQGERTVFFEYLRIERTPDGVFYVASPRGGPATRFKLIESRTDRVVFENAEHDFPSQIIYERLADGGLHARIEGTQRGRAASETWRYRPAATLGPR